MQYIFLALLINQGIVALVTEYLHFSDRFLWLRTYFSDIATKDELTIGIVKGQKLVGSYKNANRYIQETLSCQICLGKYITFINGLLVLLITQNILVSFILLVSCVLVGVINKQLFKG
jgi:hypothetical protein